jgi:hypothetical protein
MIPYLMKYVLQNKLGVLPYQVQTDIRHYDIKNQIAEIDNEKVRIA